MRKLSIIAWVGAMLLAGCGGDSSSILNEGKGGGTGASGDPVATVAVTSSATNIAADGSTSATITATAKDANNVLVAGAAVTFTTSAGDLTVASGTTGTDGTATATLSAGTAAAGTPITVTVTAGGISGKVAVTVANVQQTLTVITSAPAIPSDGSKSATITALVRNSQNQLVAGVAVNFSATSGGLAVTQGTTDVNGAATATLNASGDPSNRTITVTATAGSASATVPVSVTGTSLTVTGPTNLVAGSSGTYTVALTEAGGTTGIANQVVELSSANGNTLSAASVTTLANGQQTFTVTATKGGADTITAKALDLTATAKLTVSTQKFAFTAPAAAEAPVDLGVPATLTVTWTTTGGAPQTGQLVTFSTTRGTLSATSATVGNDGTASVSITSTIAGPAVITATGTGVTAEASIEFIATNPSSIALQSSPTTVATQGQSTLTATVRDANNNLVEGRVVDFTITNDSTGGSLSVPSATTNVQGQATTVYTASTSTSAANGVQISATVAGTAVTDSVSLTVGGQTVFLSLGTGNTIVPYPIGQTSPPQTQYEFPYSVLAIDAAGNGVNNVTITFSVESLGYFKGYQVWNGTSNYVPHYTTLIGDPDAIPNVGGCKSEDLLGNGIFVATEDYNGNGKLDPGLVVSTDVGSAVTANGGSANVNLIYPKDHAYWVYVKLTATASVSGTESSTSTSIVLPGASADYSTESVAPPGATSPYGVATTCAVAN